MFAVKDDLVVDFTPLRGDDKAELELHYNVVLAPRDYKGKKKTDAPTTSPSPSPSSSSRQGDTGEFLQLGHNPR